MNANNQEFKNSLFNPMPQPKILKSSKTQLKNFKKVYQILKMIIGNESAKDSIKSNQSFKTMKIWINPFVKKS